MERILGITDIGESKDQRIAQELMTYFQSLKRHSEYAQLMSIKVKLSSEKRDLLEEVCGHILKSNLLKAHTDPKEEGIVAVGYKSAVSLTVKDYSADFPINIVADNISSYFEELVKQNAFLNGNSAPLLAAKIRIMPPYDERISDICEVINSGYNGILTAHPHKKTINR